MPQGPEDIAREQIDRMLEQAGGIPLEYNPALPIETFDVIVTDECHHSIYNLWRQVLEVDKRDRETRAVRWERLDEDLAYDLDQLDRQVVTPDQICTVVRTYKDKVLTEI